VEYQGFIGPAYRSQAVNVAGDRCVNLYPERVESGTGKSQWALYGTPGTTLLCTLGANVRCLWGGDERMFAVAGSTLYEINSSGGIVTTYTGSLGASTNPAYIFANGTDILIISGTQAYKTNGTAVEALETVEADPLTAVSGAYLDGYFIVLRPDSNQINISGVLDITWADLDFAIRTGGQDRCNKIFVDHQQLWIFGRKTTELWYNSGNADFPFQRIEGAWVDQGLWAPDSVARIDNTILWLGGDERGVGVVWRAAGYTPKRVSTHAIEYAIRTYSTTSDAIGWGYQQGGHQFYVLTFPTAAKTWVYDCVTDQWHERAYNGGAWMYYGCSTFGGKQYVADGISGKIYRLNPEAYTDNGTAISRVRQAPHLSNEMKVVRHNRLQLDMDVGSVTSAPTMSLAISDDGGKTFTSEKSVTAGGAGENKVRVIWRKLGRARDRVYRVTTTASEAIAYTAAYIEIQQGDGS
jgi:hypothetical protein